MSDDFVSQLNVWCCLSRVLRQNAAAHTFSHCAILSNMRRKWHLGNAILVAFFTRCRTSNFFLFAYVSTPHMKMILEVFKSTLLSPSNDTRRRTTHAREESAEVLNTSGTDGSEKRQIIDLLQPLSPRQAIPTRRTCCKN